MEVKLLLLGILLFFSKSVYAKTQRIKFSFDNKEIIVALEENLATKGLLEQLPLEIKFEDFSNSEKIAYLPQKLEMGNISKNAVANRGDLTYYIPWGEFSVFL